jgi:hypothetical protein
MSTPRLLRRNLRNGASESHEFRDGLQKRNRRATGFPKSRRYAMRGRRRRRVVEDDFEDDEPTLVEFVLQSVLDPVVSSTVGRLKGAVRTAVDWTIRRFLAGGVVTALLIAGLVLLLLAGVKGLEALRCPLWLSYLTMGIVALIVALLLLKRILSRLSDDELD